MAASDARTVRPAPAVVPERSGLVRRLLRPAIVLITLVLVADALIGDKGLLEHRREASRHDAIQRELESRRHENRELRDRARRLREEDPGTIEDLARRRLGMIKPGEILFVVKDAEAPRTQTPAPTPAR